MHSPVFESAEEMKTEKEKSVAHMEELMPLITECLSRGQSVTFSPRGISMLPMLRQGLDTVTLSPVSGRLKKYDIPLYRRKDGHYVLHRIVASKDTYTCIGDNQYQYEHGIAHDQVIAVVSAFCRGDKQYSVDHVGYRLYCRVWHHSRFMRRVLRGVKRRLPALIRKKS